MTTLDVEMLPTRDLKPGQRSEVWVAHSSGGSPTLVYRGDDTLGHPPDLEVEIRVVRTTDWAEPIQAIPLFGGQGTINVNSWSPDGRRFAYVAYPIAEAGAR